MAKKKTNHIPVEDIQSAKDYLKKRAFELKKGYPPVVYYEELEMVLEVLETGAFREWKTAMEIVMPQS